MIFESIKKIFNKKNKSEIKKEEIKPDLNKENKNKDLNRLPEGFVEKVEELDNLYKKFLKQDKKIMLIIDDNGGLISLIEDVLEINNVKEKINIVKISSMYAGFLLHYFREKTGKLKFDYAIIDLSFGGVIYDDELGNIRYEGIKVFKDIYEDNKDIKYFFYTGNSLNKYMSSSREIMSSFEEITNGKNMLDYVIFKNQFPPSVLLEVIIEKLGVRNG